MTDDEHHLSRKHGKGKPATGVQGGLAISPHAQQVVIHPGQAYHFGILATTLCGQGLDAVIQLKQQGSLPIIPDHALQPEE